MFVVVVFLEALAGHEPAVRAALLTYAHTCREREPGCRQFDVSQDPVEPSGYFLYQLYSDEASYEAHRDSAHYTDYRRLVDPWTQSRRVLTYELLSDHGQA